LGKAYTYLSVHEVALQMEKEAVYGLKYPARALCAVQGEKKQTSVFGWNSPPAREK